MKYGSNYDYRIRADAEQKSVRKALGEFMKGLDFKSVAPDTSGQFEERGSDSEREASVESSNDDDVNRKEAGKSEEEDEDEIESEDDVDEEIDDEDLVPEVKRSVKIISTKVGEESEDEPMKFKSAMQTQPNTSGTVRQPTSCNPCYECGLTIPSGCSSGTYMDEPHSRLDASSHDDTAQSNDIFLPSISR